MLDENHHETELHTARIRLQATGCALWVLLPLAFWGGLTYLTWS